MLSQDLQHLAQDAGPHPLLETSVAGLVGRVSLGQILPARASA